MFKNQTITLSTLPSNLYSKGNIIKCSMYGLLKIVKVIDNYAIKVKRLNWFEKAVYHTQMFVIKLWRRITK
jgi:hypothetical protein